MSGNEGRISWGPWRGDSEMGVVSRWIFKEVQVELVSRSGSHRGEAGCQALPRVGRREGQRTGRVIVALVAAAAAAAAVEPVGRLLAALSASVQAWAAAARTRGGPKKVRHGRAARAGLTSIVGTAAMCGEGPGGRLRGQEG